MFFYTLVEFVESENLEILLSNTIDIKGCTKQTGAHVTIVIKESSDLDMIAALFHELKHVVIPDIAKRETDIPLLHAALDYRENDAEVFKQYEEHKEVNMIIAKAVYEVYKGEIKQEVLHKISCDVVREKAEEIYDALEKAREYGI